MRVMRIGPPSSKVGKDIHSALVSWGHGTAVRGGVALIGCRPAGATDAVDAVVILPRGVLAVVGVDLPAPVKRLEAPLDGRWLADGWPLFPEDPKKRAQARPGDTLNPAAAGLRTASAAVRALQDVLGSPLPACAVLAVGPYVGEVVQPPGDLARGVKVLHPGPAALRAAGDHLRGEVFGMATVRGVLKVFEPDLPELPERVLAEEGFATPESPESPEFPKVPGVARTPVPWGPAVVVTPQPRPTQPGRQLPLVAALRQRWLPKAVPKGLPKALSKTLSRVRLAAVATVPAARAALVSRRWLPAAAAALVVVVVTALIVLFAGGQGQAPAAGTPVPTVTMSGLRFTQQGTDTSTDCVHHSYGDVQSWLRSTGCVSLHRAVFSTDTAAVAVSTVRFAQPDQATAFLGQVQTPGGGGITDLVADGVRWPGNPASFDNAALRATVTGSTVRVAQAVRATGTSTPTDPALVSLADRALQLPG